jgi:hypothetical protein
MTWREALEPEYAWVEENGGAIKESWMVEYVENFLIGQGVPVPDDPDERHQLVNAAVHIIAPVLTKAVEAAASGDYGKERWTVAEILGHEREEV